MLNRLGWFKKNKVDQGKVDRLTQFLKDNLDHWELQGAVAALNKEQLISLEEFQKRNPNALVDDYENYCRGYQDNCNARF